MQKQFLNLIQDKSEPHFGIKNWDCYSLITFPLLSPTVGEGHSTAGGVYLHEAQCCAAVAPASVSTPSRQLAVLTQMEWQGSFL